MGNLKNSLRVILFTIIICTECINFMNTNETEVVIGKPWYHSSSKKSALRTGDSLADNQDPVTEAEKRDCVCSKIYDPVCASNNESYFNLCYLECKVPKADNVSVVHQGNCIPF